MIDQRPVRRITASDRAPASYDAWPATVPAVEQLLREGWDLPGGVTLLVGENGSGKSTIVEAVAMAFGLSPEGGTRFGRHETHASESPLHEWIRLERGAGASRWGFFLRAETMHGYYTYLADGAGGPRRPGLPRDEPRRVVPGPARLPVRLPRAVLPRRARGGPVVLRADRPGGHPARARGRRRADPLRDPLTAARGPPRRPILEVGAWGLREATYEELELVAHWRRYLDAPMRYLRHVL